MIIKKRKIDNENIQQLEQLLQYPSLSKEQYNQINKELWAMRTGEKGEKSSAYYIDFNYGTNKHWAIIHDLRLEWNGHVAQIDHLLINRFFEFYVLESKNYFNGITINNSGEFSAFYKSGTYGIPSPIEQNAMHIRFLQKYFKYNKILPTRLGLEIKPKYFNYVLISPDSKINRPSKKHFNTDNVIKADTLKKTIDALLSDLRPRLSDFADMAKMIKISTMNDFSIELACRHVPIEIDYEKKFGIQPLTSKCDEPERQLEQHTSRTQRFFCAKCKKSITAKAFHFCMNNKPRFSGRAYCFNCQKAFRS